MGWKLRFSDVLPEHRISGALAWLLRIRAIPIRVIGVFDTRPRSVSKIHSFAKFRIALAASADSKSPMTDSGEETIIPGVTVITEGPAEGHFVKVGDGPDAPEFQLMIDGTTVDQLIEAAAQYANGVKSKANHRTGIESIFARMTNFTRGVTKDGKAQAKADLHLFKSSDLHDQILNLLKKIPDAIGFSAFFDGPAQRIGDFFFARCTELYSVDLVGEPAANPSGVFEVKVDSPTKDQPPETMDPKEIQSACDAAIKPHIDAIHQRLAKHEENHAALAKHLNLDANTMQPIASPDGAPPAAEEAMYSRFLARVMADPKQLSAIKDTITVELQNTSKTLVALGLVPGAGPASSIEKSGATKEKKPEEMTFIELIDHAFAQKMNASKPDFQIIAELAKAYPAKHREALAFKDERGRMTGLSKMPARREPYVKPVAA